MASAGSSDDDEPEWRFRLPTVCHPYCSWYGCHREYSYTGDQEVRRLQLENRSDSRQSEDSCEAYAEYMADRKRNERCQMKQQQKSVKNDSRWCNKLHICKLFAAGICRFGRECRNSHQLLGNVHNKRLLHIAGLADFQELVLIQALMTVFDERHEMDATWYESQLEMCLEYATASPCEELVCPRMHFCRQFVLGNCKDAKCELSHDVHSEHNRVVLERHKVNYDSDRIIIEGLLKHKYTQGTNGFRRMEDSQPQLRKRVCHCQQNQQKEKGSDLYDMVVEELMCAICLDVMQEATTLGCGHTFCGECIDDLRDASDRSRCPTCRKHITYVTHCIALDNIIREMKILETTS